MHRNARAAGHEAENVIARHRRTALRQLDQQVARANDTDAAVDRSAAAPPATGDNPILTDLLGDRLVATLDGDQSIHYRLRADGSFADRGVKRGDIGQLEEAGHGGEVLEREQPLQRQAAFAQLSRQQLLPGLDRLFATFLGEVVPDLVTRSRAANEIHPVPTGSRVLGLRGEDLHHVAVREN